jgi:hypothetical protein
MSTPDDDMETGSPPAPQEPLPPSNEQLDDSTESEHRPKLEQNKVTEVEEVAIRQSSPDEVMKEEHDDELEEGQELEAPQESLEVPSEKESDIVETMEADVSKEEETPLPEKAEAPSEAPQIKTDPTEQAAEDSATSKEQPYSTRGRSNDREISSGEEKFSAIEALEEIGRVKESPPATLGVSFLESLSDTNTFCSGCRRNAHTAKTRNQG